MTPTKSTSTQTAQKARASKSKSYGPTFPLPTREPTAQEAAAIKEFVGRHQETPKISLTPSVNGGKDLTIHHDEQWFGYALLADALGTADNDFMTGLIAQLTQLSCVDSEVNQPTLDFMLSVIKDNRPRDQLETMMGAQMAAVHVACMAAARRVLTCPGSLEQADAERGLSKLARTFAGQMEALKRYRTAGTQTVQNISVADRAQAIVGNVTQAATEAPPLKSPSSEKTSSSNVIPLPADAKKGRAPRAAAARRA